jgi:hypothetical protein
MSEAAKFRPIFSVRHGTRYGIVPGKSKERPLGKVNYVSLAESLCNYRAALRNTGIECENEVIYMHADGITEVFNWAGEAV